MTGTAPRIRFGPSGNSDSFYAQGYTATWQAPEWLSDMGLHAFEYSLGHGIRIREETAATIRKYAEAYDIQMSVHFPYYINLVTTDPENMQKNKEYFLRAVTVGKQMGAVRGVFHPGSAGKADRKESLHAACALLKEIIETLDDAGLGLDTFALCPETMGKLSQLGDLEEMLTLCRVDERLLPCVDFGHLHCRGMGSIRTQKDYAAILDAVENGAGSARAKRMHIHFSRIEFTKAGEKMHHTFADTQFGPEFPPLAELLYGRRYTPVVICESRGTMAEDALTMQKMYRAWEQ
ncbi:MAG TPA: TIM barrel protein [Feifaniaceae bacterium]|nr:TIM barrel protein [Feifaniaceae bacterium]